MSRTQKLTDENQTPDFRVHFVTNTKLTYKVWQWTGPYAFKVRQMLREEPQSLVSRKMSQGLPHAPSYSFWQMHTSQSVSGH